MYISKALRYGLYIIRGSHRFTYHPHTNHISFTFQLQGITALWLVLIAPTHEGMARLSWSGGWLVVTYQDKFLAAGTEPGNGHPSQY